MEHIYVLVVLGGERSPVASRAWGWYPTPEEARADIFADNNDLIFESGSYHYAVIEEVPPGLMGDMSERRTWWFVADYDRGARSLPQELRGRRLLRDGMMPMEMTWTAKKILFELTEEQSEIANAWIREHNGVCPIKYPGAIGGKFGITFTPTTISIGVLLQCSCGSDKDLSPESMPSFQRMWEEIALRGQRKRLAAREKLLDVLRRKVGNPSV